MSVIIAKKTKNGFIMAGDSQATLGTQRFSVTKIFKAKGEDELYIGGVGTLRDINILTTITNLIDLNAIRRETFDVSSIISYTIPTLQKALKEHGRLITDRDGSLCWGSSVLICYKDKAFEISSFFEVTEISNFAAIGSPQDFAYGAYSVLNKFDLGKLKLNDYNLVKEIMKMCIEETIHVFYPILIIDTSKDKDFTRIDGEIHETEIKVKNEKEKENE